jgi:hypothetical protein
MLQLIKAFLLGVIDACKQRGNLSSGRSSDTDMDWNETYDRGANVGEWLWDLNIFASIARAPWVCRADA